MTEPESANELRRRLGLVSPYHTREDIQRDLQAWGEEQREAGQQQEMRIQLAARSAVFYEAPAPEPGVEPESAFRRMTREMSGVDCGCACHTGTGYDAACEHCMMAPAEQPSSLVVELERDLPDLIPPHGTQVQAGLMRAAEAIDALTAEVRELRERTLFIVPLTERMDSIDAQLWELSK